MKGLDRGPKIELSKLGVPGPVRELWNDLRAQHLLPVVAVLLVGLVAIPVLLGGSSDSEPAPEAGGGPVPATASGPGLVVSKYAPALRDERHRFRGRKAVNPFATPADAKQKSSADNGGESAEGGPPVLTEPTPSPEEGGGGETPPGEEGSISPPTESGGEGSKSANEREKEAEIDIRVTTIHFDGDTSETLRLGVKPLTKLPTEAIPALTYVEPNPVGRAAIMSVSPEVTALAGSSPCLEHSSPCKLLLLRLGEPETLVFGPRGLTYRVKLERIGSFETDRNFAKDPEGNDHASVAPGAIAQP